MIKFTVFPHLRQNPDEKANPYIQNFISSLNRKGEAAVINPPHKNPLLSILPVRRWGDAFIFNWPENIPDVKYGILQATVALCFILVLKFSGKKIVWVLHNKKPHANGHTKMKKFLISFIARKADLILTHATEGVEMIRGQYPSAACKTHFLHHPTVNRLPVAPPAYSTIMYDLLIWGSISRYKGVLEYVSFLRKHPEDNLKVCIVGRCSSPALLDELKQTAPSGVSIIPDGLSFEELGKYITRSRFVLAPYCPESILSSGILMDSLSFGAKVIGPEVGSFKDYAHEPRLKVYTFRQLEDIAGIVSRHKEEQVSLEDYRLFLEENNWQNFGDKVIKLVNEIL